MAAARRAAARSSPPTHTAKDGLVSLEASGSASAHAHAAVGYDVLESDDEWPCTSSASALSQSSTAWP
jgi:hypothetical protein